MYKRQDTGRFNIRGFANITEGSIDGLDPVCGRSGCSNLVETPGRATFDLFFNANISDNIALNMAIRNITNEKFYDWASINGKTVDDPELELYSNSGRTFSASIKYIF